MCLALCITGCTTQSTNTNASANLPASEQTTKMIGEWGVDGEVSLIVSKNGDQIVLSAPANDTWRMDLYDAKEANGTVTFVQKNNLHSGEAHPFNGVACNTTIRLVDSDRIEMTMTTVHTPKGEPELLVRIK